MNARLLSEADAWLNQTARNYQPATLEAHAELLPTAVEILPEADAEVIPIAESVASGSGIWFYAVGKGIVPGVYRTYEDAK